MSRVLLYDMGGIFPSTSLFGVACMNIMNIVHTTQTWPAACGYSCLGTMLGVLSWLELQTIDCFLNRIYCLRTWFGTHKTICYQWIMFIWSVKLCNQWRRYSLYPGPGLLSWGFSPMNKLNCKFRCLILCSESMAYCNWIYVHFPNSL